MLLFAVAIVGTDVALSARRLSGCPLGDEPLLLRRILAYAGEIDWPCGRLWLWVFE
jgi:hypothetical protein